MTAVRMSRVRFIAILCLAVPLMGGIEAVKNSKQIQHFYNELKTRVDELEKQLQQCHVNTELISEQLTSLTRDMASIAAVTGYPTTTETTTTPATTTTTEIPFMTTASGSTTTASSPEQGGVYTRWGRRICEGANFIHEGIMSAPGNRFNGSGGNYICLHTEPEWAIYMDGDDATTAGRGVIYGVEYHGNPDEIFDSVNLIGTTFLEQNVPCALCASARRSVVMLSGHVTCPITWSMEYWGYLMSDNHQATGRTEFVCVDHAPEARDGGSQPQLETSNIYHVEARCGSLPCPQYVDNREITCVVCSK